VADLPRPDVPRSIAIVRDFVNTTDYETGSDELSTAADLSRYLLAEELVARPVRATSDDLRVAVALRTALRSALELNHDGSVASLPDLESALVDLPVALSWVDGAVAVRPAALGARGALAGVGVAAVQAAADGLWWRLKICASDECEWAYYDHSKNRSRNWCEYGCGNKIKTRAYRARRSIVDR